MITHVCACVSNVSRHLVEHAVKESGDHGEHRGLESLQIVHQCTNVTLKVTDLRSVHQDHALYTNQFYLKDKQVNKKITHNI